MGSPDYCGLHRPQLRAGPAWWPTLPERDAFQHSLNSAHRSITLPCQNRGPAKDERKTYGYARVSGASGADANNLEIQAGCWPTASRFSRTLAARAPRTGPD